MLAVDDVLDYCFGFPNKPGRGRSYFHSNNVHHVNKRFLSSFEKYIRPPSHHHHRQILFVKSAMGTGKTSRFLDYINDTTSVLVISSRITYTNFMCSKNPEFENYLTLGSHEIDYMNNPKVVLQYQSLGRIRDIDHTENYARWEVVFLDELDSIFKESISSTMTPRQKADNMTRFSKLITSIPTVVVCDANLTEWHYDVLFNHVVTVPRRSYLVLNSNRGLFEDGRRTLRVYTACSLSPNTFIKDFIGAVKHVYRTKYMGGDEPIKTLVQLEQHLISSDRRCCSKDVTIGAAEDAYMWILANWYRKTRSGDPILNAFIGLDACTDVVNDVVKRGKNVVIVCASKRHAQMFYTYFTRYEKMKGGEVVMVTGDSDSQVKARFSQTDTLNEALSTCRVFIYTSCFKVGIDVSCDRFDTVYCFLNSVNSTSPLNVSDVYQMVGRVRKYDTLAICVTLPQIKKKKEIHTRHKPPTFIKNSNNNQTVSLIASKLAVESSLKRDPWLYVSTLLKLLYVTIKQPELYYGNKRYSTIDDLCKSLVPYIRTQHVLGTMILRYPKFEGRIGRPLYDELKSSVLHRLSTETPLFSFDLFDAYVDYSRVSSRHEHRWHKVKEVYEIVTSLTTERGVYRACAAFDETDVDRLIRQYYMPRGGLDGSEMLLDESSCWSVGSSSSDELFTDVRLYDQDQVDDDSKEIKVRCIEKIKRLLYNSFLQASKQQSSISFKEFTDRIPDLRAAIYYRSNEPAVMMRLYETFVSEHVPSQDDIDTIVDMVRHKIGFNKTILMNINKFLMFAITG